MTGPQLEREAREAKKKPKPKPIGFAPIKGRYESPVSGDPRFAPIKGTYQSAVYETTVYVPVKRKVPPPLPPYAPPPKRKVPSAPSPTRMTESRKSYLEYEKKQQEQALDVWKGEVRGQYPAAFYEVKFTGEGMAQIFERGPSAYKPIVMPSGIRMLERGAQQEWLRQEKKKRKGKWVQPQFKGVSKRFGGLAEYDIPYNIDQLFAWKKEDLTLREFEQKYGPFVSSLGLVEGARITHVRRTGRGFEMKYLEPEALDVTKPWGVTGKDVEALEKQGKLFAAHLAKGFMAGGIWRKGGYTPEQFKAKYDISFELPKESFITGWRRGPEGYEIKYMPKKELEALPTRVREEREPTFWEVPLWEHLTKGWEGLTKQAEAKRRQIFGPSYALAVTPQRVSERRIGFLAIGAVKRAEATVGAVEALVGRPSVRSYIPTLTGAFLTMGSEYKGVGFAPPTPIVRPPSRGLSPLEVEWESVKEHPEMIVGEVAFDVALSYALGKVMGKTWEKAVGAKTWVKKRAPAILQKKLWPKTYLEQHVLTWTSQPSKYVIQEQFGFTQTFRPEYRGTGFPTKYEVSLGYAEWLKPRKALETSLIWGKTAYPGYGVSIEKGAKPLTFERKLAQAERVPAYRTELTPRLGLVEGKPEYTFTSWSVPTGKETMFTQRAALEFQQSLQRAMPTRYYIPTTKGMAIQPFKGTPTTPFEQSLSKAFATPEKIVRGGRQFLVSELAVKPATYKIAEQTMRELGIAKTKTATTSFMKLRQAVFKPISVAETAKKTVAPTIIPHPFLWGGEKYPSIYERAKTPYAKFKPFPTMKLELLKYPVTKEKKKPKEVVAFKPKIFAETIRMTVQAEKQGQKQLQTMALRLKQIESTVQKPAQIQVVRQKQALRLQQIQVQKLRQIQASVTGLAQTPFLAHPPYMPPTVPTPTPTPPPPTPPPIIPTYRPFEMLELQRKRRRGPRWGAWYFRRHPIARPRDIIALVKGRDGKPKRVAKRQRLTITAFNGKILGKPSVAPSANLFNKRMKQLKLRNNGTRRGKVRCKQSRSPLDSFNRIRSVL